MAHQIDSDLCQKQFAGAADRHPNGRFPGAGAFEDVAGVFTVIF